MRPLSIAILLLLPTLAFAQPERYELGQRLKAFEQAWEKQTDKEARKRALVILPKVTQQFFSLQLGEAGRTLDEARFSLVSKDGPSDTVKWLTSLCFSPEKRLYGHSPKILQTISVTVKPFYKIKGPMPKHVSATLRFGQSAEVPVPLDKLPATVLLPVPIGLTNPVVFTCRVGGWTLFSRSIPVVVDPNMDGNLESWKVSLERIDPRDSDKRSIASATFRDHVELIQGLFDGDVPETDMPIIEIRDSLSNQQLWSKFVPTEFQSLPLGKTRTMPFRVRQTAPNNGKDKHPVVIALHGAGGTENLFFEGYGDGQVAKECKKRGWLLVAPRSGINFSGGPPVAKLIDALEKEYPIDRKRIFVVGHSMGAGQTISVCTENPKLFAAAAALGGGGRVKDAKPFANLHTFVGVGDKDFALSGAKALNKSLADGGAKNLTYKEYPDIEHLVIVREALPDVFALFDKVSDAVKKGK